MRFTKLENKIHLKNYKFYILCIQYTGYLSVPTRQAIRYIMNSNDTELEQIQAPEYLTSQFITREQVSERTTRSSQKLNIPLTTTYTLKSRGAKMDPCGTPIVTGRKSNKL